tara:strand:+ start:63 stop:779 length:717 start_codon:yes stop_codon:yes gene_type:complete
MAKKRIRDPKEGIVELLNEQSNVARLPNEMWKPLIKYQEVVGDHLCSSFGRIKRISDGFIYPLGPHHRYSSKGKNTSGNGKFREVHCNIDVLKEHAPQFMIEDWGLHYGNKTKTKLLFTMHRAVAESFIPLVSENLPREFQGNQDEWEQTPTLIKGLFARLLYVDHIDDNGGNNSVNNVRWVTPRGNQHANKSREFGEVNTKDWTQLAYPNEPDKHWRLEKENESEKICQTTLNPNLF